MSTSVLDITAEWLARLNSATQYPSIPTYHVLGQRGRLTEERATEFDPADVYVTEKIDGTNARIILAPDSPPVIGSRTELLHCLGDVIHNPAQGIVDTVRGIAGWAHDQLRRDGRYVVLYGEVYGGKTSSGARNYSTVGATGFRLFDVAEVPAEVLGWDRQKIAAWRDGGGQGFRPVAGLRALAEVGVDLVPALEVSGPPASVADTHRWLTAAIIRTHAALDDTGKGSPEGVVVRSADRGHIAKIRFEDYRRQR